MKIKLPRDVLFHHDLQLMVFRPRGVLNEKVIDEIVAFLEKAEEKADKPFNRYSDLSKLEAIHLNFDYIVRVSLHRRLSYMKHPPVKTSVSYYVVLKKTTSNADKSFVNQVPLLLTRSLKLKFIFLKRKKVVATLQFSMATVPKFSSVPLMLQVL